MATPIRRALREGSGLHERVQSGLQALQDRDKKLVEDSIRQRFADSLNLDEALRAGNEGAHRWDYLLGIQSRSAVIALEPHSVKESEVSVVIKKKKAALEQLRPHLRDGHCVEAWFWVQSSGEGFLNTERAARQLAAAGIAFAGRSLKPKNLETDGCGSSARPSAAPAGTPGVMVRRVILQAPSGG